MFTCPSLWLTFLIQTAMRSEFRPQHLCHGLTTTCNSSPDFLFWPLWGTCLHGANTHKKCPGQENEQRQNACEGLPESDVGRQGGRACCDGGDFFSALLTQRKYWRSWTCTLRVKESWTNEISGQWGQENDYRQKE